MLLNVHNFLARSTVNGPGTRAVIWVQGCDLACPGCFNPDTHDFAPRRLTPIAELAEQIVQIEGLEGVTISGGEPFLQAEALAALASLIQTHQLGVIVFSGFTFEQLSSSLRRDWQALLASTDLLIAGPFIQAFADHLPLRGSRNQTLHFLTERYRPLQHTLEHGTHSVEVLIDPTGQVILTGFPAQDLCCTLSPGDSDTRP